MSSGRFQADLEDLLGAALSRKKTPADDDEDNDSLAGRLAPKSTEGRAK